MGFGILKNEMRFSGEASFKSEKEVTQTQQTRIWINYPRSPVKPHKSVKSFTKVLQTFLIFSEGAGKLTVCFVFLPVTASTILILVMQIFFSMK